jgi:hypothetical protein
MLKPLARICITLTVALFLTAAPAPAQENGAASKIRVVIIDGQNNHDWRTTTPHMKKVLEECGRFTVDVSTNLKPNDKPGQLAPTTPFPPDLSKFDVVLSNYNGAAWPAEFNKALEDRLKEGKIGLVIVHAANNSFGNWAEYNQPFQHEFSASSSRRAVERCLCFLS